MEKPHRKIRAKSKHRAYLLATTNMINFAKSNTIERMQSGAVLKQLTNKLTANRRAEKSKL